MLEQNTRRAMTDQEIIAERERRALVQRHAFAAVDKATAAEDDGWPSPSIAKGFSPPAPPQAAPIAPPPVAAAETLREARQQTHGDFSSTARIAQALKAR